jgi:hypothetical protein
MKTILSWLPWILLAAAGAVGLRRVLRRSEDPASLLECWLGTMAVLAVMGWWCIRLMGVGNSGGLVGAFGAALIIVGGLVAGGIVIAILWGRRIGEWVARPLTGLFDDGGKEM